jgi:DNA-binding CsgD family transcriptional regulator
MNQIAEDILMHIGVAKRSGRYPYGSGDNPYQHSGDFLSRVEMLKKQGWKETPENIKKEFGLTTTQYRTEKSLAKDQRRMLDVARAKSLKEDGLGATEIGRKMGIPESTVRSLLNENSEARMNQARKTADFLRERVNEKGMIDVGTGVERELGVSKEKLNEALYILEKEGYPVYKGGIPQATNPGKQINQRVLCPPGTEHKEIYNFDQVHSVQDYVSHDGGETFDKFVYPKSMDSKRLQIRYAEDGGIDKDGIVEIRRGVDDLSLGNSHYSQVRILVDDKKYIKGMAVYSDDLPDGVDVVFNTNKTKDVAKMDVLKTIKEDPDNPFGSLIKPGGQSYYIDKDGNKQLSLINKRADEGDWDEWKDALPSQFLGKQSLTMAKKQLKLAEADKLAEYDEICSLTNPTVKKHLLQKFADECDSAAVHLQAAALPGQKYHVIIPINTLKDNEVYAPGYEPGTKVALVRYPHGGTFEIPILTVNNKNADANKIIGKSSIDAIGINKNIADRLSGADFDGDTVMVIPTHDKGGKVKITSTPALKGLEGFDPKLAYPERPGMKYMKNTGTQMGIVSNLITDMTLGGASQDELARAVRHSMVVIDAEKHKLDYKQSEIDNDIASLKKKYQRTVTPDGKERVGGASTILSRAKGETSVDKRQGSANINQKGKPWYDPSKPEGAYIYKTADDLYYDVKKVNKRTGEVTTVAKKRTQKSTRMAETDDATTLVSDAKHPMEMVYADYANSMKSLANKARIEMVNTGKIAYSASAKATYQKEVESLEDKLNTALLNATRERAAQRQTNAAVSRKIQANPDMKPGDIKKASQQALTANRKAVGSVSRRDRNISITDREWEAIQAGAISENKLKQILNNADTDGLRQRATPRATTAISTAKANKIKAMSNSNYTLEEIARACGVSTSTVSNYMKGAN